MLHANVKFVFKVIFLLSAGDKNTYPTIIKRKQHIDANGKNKN